MARMKVTAAALYELCQNGDEEAWSHLMTWCRIRANKILPEEAEDVSQEVCMKLLRGGLDSVRDPRAFLGFVRRSVDNEVFSRLRKSGRTISLEQPVAGQDGDDITLGDVVGSHDASQEGQTDARMALLALKEALEELPDYCNGVMTMYVRYQLGQVDSYKEMAAQLKVSVNTLGVQIKRCLDQLRELPMFAALAGAGEV